MTFTVTIHTAVVIFCWVAGLAFAVVDVILVPDWAALSTAFIVIAATMTVKRSVDRYAASWTQAYELGRSAKDQEVRKIR